ncbi:MAG: SDR family oxidoreductase [Deltaproteobacteria bacterium]|nr:SDR family oxidoreductase [Deltaproteobacteria bacterium]
MMKSVLEKETQRIDRVALVTGGAIRVGRAITHALAHAGYRVAVHYYHSQESAEQLAADLDKSGMRSALIQGDLTRPGSAARIVTRAAEIMGRLDLLVNNAAVLADDDSTTADLARMKLLNVDAPSACLAAAVPYLQSCAGCVVNIADTAGLAPFVQYKAYSRTQSALISMTESKALELAASGVRVNAICPGTVLPHEDYGPSRVARIVRDIPMGRIGRPEDVADAVVYLVGARFVTGQILCVDGGRVIVEQKK